MKRNLNENSRLENELDLEKVVKICVSSIREDDDTMDCNELRDIFVNAGAHVEGSHGLMDGKPVTIMTVIGLPEAKVEEILLDFLDTSDSCGDAEDYIQLENAEDVEDMENLEFPKYEDVDIEQEEVLNEETDILDEAKAELQSVLNDVDPDTIIEFAGDPIVLDSIEGEFIGINGNGDLITETDDEADAFNAYELTDADDIYTLCDVIKDEIEGLNAYPDYDDVDIDDVESPRFEKIKRHGRLDEKKRGCCPGTTNINEADTIDAVIADLDAKILNEAQKAEMQKQEKLQAKTVKALQENAHSLYPNVRYNGKSFDKMTLSELKSLYENIKTQVDTLSEQVLNESKVEQKSVDSLNVKKALLEYLDNEITYRTTRLECMNKLNEDGAEISDEELATLFGPAQGEEASENSNSENSEENKEEGSDENKEEGSDENKDENKENDEEVELSRIEITLKDEQAAKDLKQACLDADIPEDAIELENVNEEEDTFDNEEGSDENSENTEETPEENQEENQEESSEENTNESYEYAKYVKMLLEDEAPAEEQPAENIEETPEEGSDENSGENSDDENSDDENSDEEDKQPKFILTNTDYAFKLAKVLEDMYGISKEEFEDMIGGEIVEEESDENSDENKEENKEEGSDENKEEGSSDENSEEEIDPSDLFKNL